MLIVRTLSIDLSFHCCQQTQTYVQLDSMKIMNRTQGSDTTIYWPDTTIWLLVKPGDLMLYAGVFQRISCRNSG